MTRARLGFVIPAPNSIFEDDLASLGAAAGATVVRMAWPDDEADDDALMTGLAHAADRLAEAAPDAVCFACSSATMIDADRNTRYRDMLEARCGCPATTAGDAVLATLRSWNCTRVTLIGPYPARVLKAEAAFLEANDIRVLDSHAWELTDEHIADVAPEDIAAQIRQVATTADAVVIGCATFRGVAATKLIPDPPTLLLPVNQACVLHAASLAPHRPPGRRPTR